MSELFTTPVASNGVTAANAPQGTLAVTLVVELPAVPDAAVLTVRCDQDFLGRLAEALASSSTPEASPAERIADLELSVHVTLGRTSVPLRDVFKLMVGSVIDIGKKIADPVDLVVNDRVIARGQVVTCKGSYGVKLTHQLSGSGVDLCRIGN
jgi:flagellar motor switch protein FliN/FliY